MPSTYAHYTFGQEVKRHLKGDIEKIIAENIALYNIGLHGPDILFYYKPLSSNPINKAGNELHEKNADIFLNNGKKVVKGYFNTNAALSYLFGFICHFMLDGECHPYIEKKMEISNISHSEIEVEFDRALMEKDGLEPLSFKPTGHIVSSREYAKTIAFFFPEISENEIVESLKSMKFYLNLLVVPSKLKRILLIAALKVSGNYHKMSGLLMKHEPIAECKDSNIVLEKLYSNSVIPTVDLIMEFYQDFSKEGSLNQRFLRNFL